MQSAELGASCCSSSGAPYCTTFDRGLSSCMNVCGAWLPRCRVATLHKTLKHGRHSKLKLQALAQMRFDGVCEYRAVRYLSLMFELSYSY